MRGFVYPRVHVRILYKQTGELICTLLNTCNLESENSPLPFTCVSDVSSASTLSSFWIQVKSLNKEILCLPLVVGFELHISKPRRLLELIEIISIYCEIQSLQCVALIAIS